MKPQYRDVRDCPECGAPKGSACRKPSCPQLVLIPMKKHLVNFMSPGTFVSEVTSIEVASWDVDAAVKMSYGIRERYGAVPYGFYFTTEEPGMKHKSSGMYFLGGKVETYEEVCARNDPKEEILRSNMQNNGYKSIVTNTNSYKCTLPVNEGDVVLDVKLLDFTHGQVPR